MNCASCGLTLLQAEVVTEVAATDRTATHTYLDHVNAIRACLLYFTLGRLDGAAADGILDLERWVAGICADANDTVVRAASRLRRHGDGAVLWHCTDQRDGERGEGECEGGEAHCG